MAQLGDTATRYPIAPSTFTVRKAKIPRSWRVLDTDRSGLCCTVTPLLQRESHQLYILKCVPSLLAVGRLPGSNPHEREVGVALIDDVRMLAACALCGKLVR